MYRRLTLKEGVLRLQVVLGSSGELLTTEAKEILVRMMALQFLWWTIPGTPIRVLTKSQLEFNLIFPLPPLARLLIRVMRRWYKRTDWVWLAPQVSILRDPDWCARGQLQPLTFWLFESEVYEERFETPDEAVKQRPVVQAQPTHLELVVDNGPVPPRNSPTGSDAVHYDEIPWDFAGVGDVRGDGERTDPVQKSPYFKSGPFLRPRPHRS